MKHLIRVSLSVLLAFAAILLCVACANVETSSTNDGEIIDYAANLKLDMTSSTKKQLVSVRSFIDGDTTHFNLSEAIDGSYVLKARYLAINTPESTGKIEEYGKKASNFTKEKLSGAKSIIVESDNEQWNLDATGSRHLVWVWYRNSENDDYKNLNVEILQEGLAIASNAFENRYGEVCVNAINQARTQKLNVYSGQKDPDFFYGDAVELTLKELRSNIDSYNGVKVAFEGVITANSNNSVYVEDYDSELDMYFGISIYYGYGLSGDGLAALSVGNRSRIVGTVQYYEAGGTYQVSGLTYRVMKPDDPNNVKKISDGHSAAYKLITAKQFSEGKVEIEFEEGNKTFDFALLSMNTSVSMQNLTVKSVYTTESDTSSDGSLTLTCECDGYTISVRTLPLKDENGNLIEADAFKGKTIDVKGFVDYYGSSYQIKVLNKNGIIIL